MTDKKPTKAEEKKAAEAGGAKAAPEKPKEEEIKDLEASIAADQAHLAELQAKRDYIEFPKMVKGRTFASREEQDAAGPEYAGA